MWARCFCIGENARLTKPGFFLDPETVVGTQIKPGGVYLDCFRQALFMTPEVFFVTLDEAEDQDAQTDVME